MFLIYLFFFFGQTETVDIYSTYSSKYEQLCTNFPLKTIGLTSKDETFRVSTPGVHKLPIDDDSYFFNVIDCNSFNWAMSSSNNNRFVLSENDTLRIWVDDASSFDQASDNMPNNVSKQLTSMINSMGVHPEVTISDAMTHEICQTISNFDFDAENMWWEAIVNCSVSFYYEIQFHDLIGFSSPTGQQPISNTNVYPPIPDIIKTESSNEENLKLSKVSHCPCIPSLNAVIHDDNIYISSTNFINYSILKNVEEAILVDFIDNSLIYIDNNVLTIQNFANLDQIFTYDSTSVNRVSSPNFCSFNSALKRDQPSSVIAWNDNKKDEYIYINLTDSPYPVPTRMKKDEEIFSITSTLSSKSDFYIILRNKLVEKFYLRKINMHNEIVEEIELTQVPYESNPLLYWSPYGYIFLLFNNRIQCSSESQILFSDLQFIENKDTNFEFRKIIENSKGDFIIGTNKGTIFFMSIDAPILSKIQTRYDPDDSDIAVTENDMFIILTSDGQQYPIPIESEKHILKMNNQFWRSTICPSSVEISENFPEGNLYVDKSDMLTFSGSIFSKDRQKFIVHVSDNFYVNTTSYYEEVIQLQPQTNRFIPLQKQNFNMTLMSKSTGIGRFVVHTSSPSWICGNEMITRNFIIGCPLQKELRVRDGELIKHFYTNLHIRPIVDVYNFGQFVEEYKGNLTVISDKKIGFLDKGNNVLNSTNGNKIILYKFDEKYKLTLIADDSWSYCNLSTDVYAEIVSPNHTYYYYSLIGFVFYCVLMMIYIAYVSCQWKKKRKIEKPKES